MGQHLPEVAVSCPGCLEQSYSLTEQHTGLLLLGLE